MHIQSCAETVPGLETAWLQSMADEHGSPDAIVAQAHPADPDIASVIEANTGHRLLRGVRDMLSPRTIGTDAFADGWDLLADAELSLEVLVPYPKFDAVCTLADRRPDATLILGHAGQAEWREPPLLGRMVPGHRQGGVAAQRRGEDLGPGQRR